MKVKRIYAVNFRNYKECCLEITSMVNIFYGQNAQGKTNLLEAMFYAPLECHIVLPRKMICSVWIQIS